MDVHYDVLGEPVGRTVLERVEVLRKLIEGTKYFGSCGRAEYGHVYTPDLVMIASRNKNGYRSIKLEDGDKNFFVHRLVCLGFHGFPTIGRIHVDHINRVRDDNRPDNLRWATVHENMSNRGLPKRKKSNPSIRKRSP